MRSRNTSSLVLGIFVGIAVASAAFVLWTRSRSVEPQQQAQAANENPDQPDQSTPSPANPAMAVQLNDGEHRQIGIQTTEATRQTVTEEIVATGRVEEAETTI